MDISYLLWLQDFRNATGNVLTPLMEEVSMFAITYLLLIPVFVYWCLDKKKGLYVLFATALSLGLNAFVKLNACVYRPWIRDPRVVPAGDSIKTATGYSFPSGHSQNAAATFGGIALWTKHKAVRVIAIVIAVLVCFSRMYLGVHTPLDVGVGALSAVVLMIALYPLMKKNDPRITRAVLIALFLLALAYQLFMSLASFPADVDPENLAEAVKNAYTLLGCSAGLLIVHEVDARVIHFDTRAVWWAQIIKAVLGLGLVLALRVGLKPALAAILGDSGWASAIRYFLMVLFAGCVWPLTFKLFGRLGQNGAAR